MTHPNLGVAHFVSAYCLAIQYLIKNPKEEGKGEKAYNIALEYLK